MAEPSAVLSRARRKLWRAGVAAGLVIGAGGLSVGTFSVARHLEGPRHALHVVASGGGSASGCPVANPCSLDAALSQTRDGVISLGAGTYSGPLVISQNVTLSGYGEDASILSGSSAGSPVVAVDSGKVTLENMSIEGGAASNEVYGAGGIDNKGTLTLEGVHVEDNTFTDGVDGAGGIVNLGTLTLENSEVTGNSAMNSMSCAGGIANDGVLSVVNSAVTSDQCTSNYVYGAGGISNGGYALAEGQDSSTANLSISSNSTVSDDATETTGCYRACTLEGAGGVLSIGPAAISESYLNDDSALFGGGGIFEDGQLSVTSSEFYSDSAGVNGGAIDSGEFEGSGDLVVKGTSFTYDTADYDGGAIDSGDDSGSGSATISHSSFTYDGSQQDGGAIDSGDDSGSGQLTISSSTFAGDSATWDGGAIDSGDQYGEGSATVASSSFTNNSTVEYDGGAIDSGDSGGSGQLTVSGSTFEDNVSLDGGALDSGDYGGSGSLTVASSSFEGDSATANGGAIDSGDDGGSGVLTVTTSTFDGESAVTDGGAIDSGNEGGTGWFSIDHSTLYESSAPAAGSAVDNGDARGDGGSSAGYVTSSTIDESSGAAALDNATGTLVVAGTIVAQDGGSAANCAGAITDGGYNLEDDGGASCGFSASLHDLIGDPDLGPLAGDGGATETMEPAPGSPVLNRIPDPTKFQETLSTGQSNSHNLCGNDQQGNPANRATGCDIGAVDSDGTFYAYPDGEAADPGSCPATTDSSEQCSLTEALGLVPDGGEVRLASSSEPYYGNFTVDSSVFILPGAGVKNPVLDGDGDSAVDCPTSSCDGPVLSLTDSADVTLKALTITDGDNEGGSGGGLYLGPGSKLTATKTTFSDDRSSRSGGAMEDASGSGGALSVSGSTFTDDTASDGGAIADEASTSPPVVTITTSSFEGDSAASYGGGVENSDGGRVTISGSAFSSDQAADGGAVANGDGSLGTLAVASSTFSSDSATGNGGAIDSGEGPSGNGTVTVSGSSFTLDSSEGNGGAIDSGDNSGNGGVVVTASTFEQDTSGADGGAIDSGDALAGSGSTSVSTSSFYGDQAAAEGGGIASGAGGGTSWLGVHDSTLTADEAPEGSALYAAGADGFLVDSTLYENARGPALYSSGGLVVAGSIVAAGGGAASPCASPVVDGGFNLEDDLAATCGFSAADHDVIAAPDLGALGDHGGATETLDPGATSPVLDQIPDETRVDFTLDGGGSGYEKLCQKDQDNEKPDATYGCAIGSVDSYNSSLPIVTSLAKSSGTDKGGETVVLSGVNLALVVSVTFGGEPATILEVATNGESITVTTPASSGRGSVPVVVTTSSATSPYRPGAVYRYN